MPRRPPTVGQFDRAFDFVARIVREEAEVPVAALAVATSNRLLRAEAFGKAQGGLAEPDIAFPIASITKPVVVTAVMQLVQSGDLVLTAPLAEYLPDFAPPPATAGDPGGEAITTKHVLTHTSGITDLGMEAVIERRPAPEDFPKLLRERALAFAPGSAYTYCSDSFYLLGELLERFIGRPYPDALRERLFAPLGLAHTGFDPTVLDCRRAGLLWTVPPIDDLAEAEAGVISLAMPGGGLWSTTGDLVTFAQAILSGGERNGIRILAPAFVDLMTREQTAGVLEPGTPPREPRYGLGWDRPTLDGSMPGSLEAYGHSGASGARLWIDPGHDLVIVYLMNRWGASDRWWRGTVNAVYGSLA